MRQCDVSGAQLVDRPEGGEAAVDPVAALDPDQARHQLLLQSVLDACKISNDLFHMSTEGGGEESRNQVEAFLRG